MHVEIYVPTHCFVISEFYESRSSGFECNCSATVVTMHVTHLDSHITQAITFIHNTHSNHFMSLRM